MNVMRNRKLAAALLAVFLATLGAGEAFARGGFRGGGFKAPSFRSIGTSRGFSGWGSATRPSLKSSPFSSAPRSLAPAASSTPRFGSILGGRSSVSTQRSLFDSARRSGTLFSTREAASTAFRSQYAAQYGSRFAAEPATRPAYIPATTMAGGRSVNIVYSPTLGGYGYFHPGLGTWMLYDALADTAIANSLMAQHRYYWGAPVYLSHGSGFLTFALGVIVFLVIAAAIARAARRRRYY